MEGLKELFFRETLRMWHFENIVEDSGMSRERVHYYLKKLVKNGFLRRVKPKGKMPYYIANRDFDRFRIEKRFYGLKILESAGLFEYLNSLKNVKTAIVFGSFSRGDWNKSSDVDLFVYGNIEGFNKRLLESKLKRDIQLFNYEEAKEIVKDLDVKVISNIIKGFNVKGSMEPFEVSVNA